MTKSMRMRQTEHVARMVKVKNAHRILVGKHEGKRSLCVDVRIILKEAYILNKYHKRV
jgi:hypothetical protein